MIIKLFKILEGLKLNLSFYFLILFSVVSSLLEILSISSILPLMGIIIDPEIILKHRYLENFFRNKLSLGETPLSILYKEQSNPFKNKPNKLTDRQIKKRKRIVKRRKK